MPVGVTLNPILLQVNYHGPYILTRLLEPVLIASKPSRVVNVASVEHRIGYIKDIRKFMFDAKKFLYSETKLGNVLLTYEHQRRLGSYGVQVCLLSNNAMTSAHLQWPTGLSTSTAFVVYQYCLCCLPMLPFEQGCLPLDPDLWLSYAVTVNPLKTPSHPHSSQPYNAHHC